MTDIGTRLKLVRNEWGLTQKEFAARIGVTNAHISKIEKGLTVPSNSLTKLICQQFKVSEQWLVYGKGPHFVEDLWSVEDEAMYSATDKFNKLLKKDGIVRSIMVELESLYAEIIDPPLKSELQTIEYLTLCLKLITHIEYYVSDQKKGLKDTQLLMEYSKQMLIENLKGDIDSFEKYFNDNKRQ